MRVYYYLRALFVMMFLAGAAFIGGFFVNRALERKTQLAVISEFEGRMVDKNTVLDHAYVGSEWVGNRPMQGETIAILKLERLGIEVSVAEGVEKDILKISAGHFPQADLPGEGNFAIAGHSSRVYVCLFNQMHNAVLGDIISVQTRNAEHQYMVTDMFIAEPEDTYYLNHTKESAITIITCTNDGAERLIIRGVEI